MENIGNKIKRIRSEKSLSQDNVYKPQSYLSKVEKGDLTPSDDKLRIIAENLEIPFDKLISDTDWVSTSTPTIKNTQYGFSPTKVIVHLDELGIIRAQMKSYPLLNANGEENKFCPDSGLKLLTHCKKCDRSIESSESAYCTGCGQILFEYIELFKSWKIKNIDYSTNEFSNKLEQQRVEKYFKNIKSIQKQLLQTSYFESFNPQDNTSSEKIEHIKDENFGAKLCEALNIFNFNSIDELSPNWSEEDLDYVTRSDFTKQTNAPSKLIKNYWITYKCTVSFATALLKEFKSFEYEIMKKVNSSLSQEEKINNTIYHQVFNLLEDIEEYINDKKIINDTFDPDYLQYINDAIWELESFDFGDWAEPDGMNNRMEELCENLEKTKKSLDNIDVITPIMEGFSNIAIKGDKSNKHKYSSEKLLSKMKDLASKYDKIKSNQ